MSQKVAPLRGTQATECLFAFAGAGNTASTFGCCVHQPLPFATIAEKLQLAKFLMNSSRETLSCRRRSP